MSDSEAQPSASVSPSANVLGLLEEQRQRWRAGDRVLVEQYVRLDPELAADREGLLDLLYSEVLLREECGEDIAAEEYPQRFPQYADAIARLLALHRALRQAVSVVGSSGVRAATYFPFGEGV